MTWDDIKRGKCANYPGDYLFAADYNAMVAAIKSSYPPSIIVYSDGITITATGGMRQIASGIAGIDDVRIIQAAIDYTPPYGCVYLSGVFRLNDTGATAQIINLSKQGMSLTGNSKIITNAGFERGATVYFYLSADDITIGGLHFELDSLLGTFINPKSIIGIDANHSTIKDCRFSSSNGGGSAIERMNTDPIRTGIRIKDNNFSNINGIFLHRTTGAIIEGNIIKDTSFMGIELYNCVTDCIVSNNLLINTVADYVPRHNYGIFVGHESTNPRTCHHNLISNNTIKNYYVPIYLNIGTTYNQVVSNKIYIDMPGCSSGILGITDSQAIIEGNNIYITSPGDAHGIALYGAASAHINNNYICNSSTSETWGISVTLDQSNPGRAIINGNIISGLATRGVSLRYINSGIFSNNLINITGDYGVYFAYDGGAVSDIEIKNNTILGANIKDIFLHRNTSNLDINHNVFTNLTDEGSDNIIEDNHLH